MSRNLGIGIRVDVDTHAGMRDGVPRLLEVFGSRGARASFYLSMGPDRSGRALLNAFRPGFLAKMRRTSAARVYGLRTILSGTLLPSRRIALAFPDLARRIREEGHETGVHAWDHRTWQDRLLKLPHDRIDAELDRGASAYRSIFGTSPGSFAAPAWLTCDRAVLHQDTFGLDFASDCRGVEPFQPIVAGTRLATPQVPATLPTLDELLGFQFETAESYFEAMIERLQPGTWPVLTVHAELEGGPYAEAFAGFLDRIGSRGFRGIPLGRLLEERRALGPLGACELGHAPVSGRHGVVSMQLAGGSTAGAATSEVCP